MNKSNLEDDLGNMLDVGLNLSEHIHTHGIIEANVIVAVIRQSFTCLVLKCFRKEYSMGPVRNCVCELDSSLCKKDAKFLDWLQRNFSWILDFCHIYKTI